MNNGELVNTSISKTVAWGVKKSLARIDRIQPPVVLYFNGVVRKEQGIEIIFNLLKRDKSLLLKVLGKCETNLFDRYQRLIKKLGITSQVQFANHYYTYHELVKESMSSHIALALYSTDKSQYAYYTDSGKVKFYMELGIPVVITDSSATAKDVKHFHAGEIVSRDVRSIEKSIKKIKQNYPVYISGVRQFSKSYYFEDYYKDKFSFLTIDAIE